MNRVKTFIPAALAIACAQAFLLVHAQGQTENFNRIATFEAFRNVPAGRTVSKKSIAEIIAASEDGRLLAYTDGEQHGIGLIDITNPASPQQLLAALTAPDAGVVRAKGWLTDLAGQRHLLQLVGRRAELLPLAPDAGPAGADRLLVIGLVGVYHHGQLLLNK
ncbi:MAG: hypothetical protein F2905_04255 [Actinobacteria bacterium]|nr:hypothetical protein [Actinomycetota bacterium]